ncbi:cation diffusion facilitator family transporter [Methylocystis parvus]|uniref:Cation transporter n=1 Tax=Methylocystis parvus TaxID=134 RepID=A0A6B8M6C4_9HYPH|nr:cation diffusion facilitator family transporter [Methylocystis parvus]QGM96883.1 cation transporter [Methylocystis parvus]WBJ99235.1 cation diffusion facilitator family transporter [Methylocystis parvus OBBP]
MSHDHPHDHGHSHAPTSFGAAFAIGTALNLGLVIAELAFGYQSNSLALVSDGVHNLSDVFGLLLAWGGSWLATRRPSASHTYGYRRASILAALGNAALLLVATGGLILEAVERLFSAPAVASGTVLWVASVAIVINTATALLFLRGRAHDLNIRGAFLHMAGDAAVSLGVVVAALLIGHTGWLWLDPAVSIAVAILIVWNGWGLMREALNLALDAVPAGVDPTAVEEYLASLPGVTDVHDLHIWAMSTTETALTAHLVRPSAEPDDKFLMAIAHDLEARFDVQHATIQIERGDGECRLAPAHTV